MRNVSLKESKKEKEKRISGIHPETYFYIVEDNLFKKNLVKSVKRNRKKMR